MTAKRKEEPAEARSLPYDVDVEQAVLGAALADTYELNRAMVLLKFEHFYDPLHQRMWATMAAMWGKGQAVTPLTVKSLMVDDASLEEVGGQQYLISLARSAPAMPNIPDYCRILANLAMRRELICIGEDLENVCYGTDVDHPPEEIAHYTADALIRATSVSHRETSKLGSDVADAVLREHEATLTGKPIPRIPTGLLKLDEEIGGLRGGDLAVIAGRSGMGKSICLGGIAVRVALAGFPVMVFSLEMTEAQWIERTLCDLDFDVCGKDPLMYQKFRNGRVSGDEIERAARAAQRLQGVPYNICDDDQLSMEDITARAKAYTMRHDGLGLIVIDYLQIIRPTSGHRDRNREQEVTALARGCKSLAKQIGWPVMVGCQVLNKGAEAEDRPPQARDIRESGSIENEADLILGPYRKAFFVENRRPSGSHDTPEYAAWKGELDHCRTHFQLVGIKNRHGRKGFYLDLYCEIGASAIRDERPIRNTISNEDAKGLF